MRSKVSSLKAHLVHSFPPMEATAIKTTFEVSEMPSEAIFRPKYTKEQEK